MSLEKYLQREQLIFIKHILHARNWTNNICVALANPPDSPLTERLLLAPLWRGGDGDSGKLSTGEMARHRPKSHPHFFPSSMALAGRLTSQPEGTPARPCSWGVVLDHDLTTASHWSMSGSDQAPSKPHASLSPHGLGPTEAAPSPQTTTAP